VVTIKDDKCFEIVKKKKLEETLKAKEKCQNLMLSPLCIIWDVWLRSAIAIITCTPAYRSTDISHTKIHAQILRRSS
jgi:hypothetical protein